MLLTETTDIIASSVFFVSLFGVVCFSVCLVFCCLLGGLFFLSFFRFLWFFGCSFEEEEGSYFQGLNLWQNLIFYFLGNPKSWPLNCKLLNYQ